MKIKAECDDWQIISHYISMMQHVSKLLGQGYFTTVLQTLRKYESQLM